MHSHVKVFFYSQSFSEFPFGNGVSFYFSTWYEIFSINEQIILSTIHMAFSQTMRILPASAKNPLAHNLLQWTVCLRNFWTLYQLAQKKRHITRFYYSSVTRWTAITLLRLFTMKLMQFLLFANFRGLKWVWQRNARFACNEGKKQIQSRFI